MRYFLSDSLAEYAPKKWFRGRLMLWVFLFFILGGAGGIGLGFYWCYKVNVLPIVEKNKELRKEMRGGTFLPPKVEGKGRSQKRGGGD